MEHDEISKTLSEILGKLRIAFESIDISEVSGTTLFTVKTAESGLLIGTGGETLHALNQIMRKLYERKDEKDTARFVVDVNGYHAKHIAEVEGQARMLAERARTFKHDVDMSPMSAYDRLIVHAALTNEPDIGTESDGEGKLRHIVVRYTGGTASSGTAPSGKEEETHSAI